ncbi:hypothetical protein BKA70DRAFT_1110775 [Coprinopsis sp. MPI-PUGE-AT-0042]|nr:hypothetical protein BKA70DRAFT_1110775 [Coprinopsis sp. MPI-PUGE-AT-0042]
MTYRDNDVYVPYNGGGGWTVVNGVFTVTDKSITGGQDPNNFNQPVFQKSINGQNKMSFRVGRSKSAGVAQWFTSKIPREANTFDDNPDKLNFAFFGSLSYTIWGNNIQGETFTVPKVMFAQGSSGSSNNWWFGGEGCRYKNGNEVRCRITRESNPFEFWQMHFRRGGNGNAVDTVAITAFFQSSSWP